MNNLIVHARSARMRGMMRVAAGTAAVALLASACSSDTADDVSDEPTTEPSSAASTDPVAAGECTTLPAQIELAGLMELTGPVAEFGGFVTNGQDAALAQINSEGYLGDSTLSINNRDTGGDPTQGATLMAELAAQDAIAVIGSILSTAAAAEAPIAQREGVPFIHLGSGGGISDVGEYIYSGTAPQSSYMGWDGEYLRDKGITNVAVIYNDNVPTTAGQAEETLPELAAEFGLTIVESVSVASDATDTSAVVTRALAAEPEAVFVFAAGPANTTLVSQIEQAGFEGEIIGSIGMGSGVLETLGDRADGVVWATDFNAAVQIEATQDFVALYESEFGAKPNNFAAAAYDTVWFLARAIKEACSVDRDDILAGMEAVGSEGFAGVRGNVQFVERVAQAGGILIEWRDGQEVPVPGYGS